MSGSPDCDRCGGRGWVVKKDGGAGSAAPCRCRAGHRRELLLKRLAIPAKYAGDSLDNFLTTHQDPAVAALLLRAKETSRRYVESFIDARRGGHRTVGLCYTGPPGCGKTHLAVSVLRQVVSDYLVSGMFVDFTSFLHQIRSTYDPDSTVRTDDVLQPLLAVDVLVIDELAAQKPSEHTLEILYLLVNGRYIASKPTIFTSNYRFPPADKPEKREEPSSIHLRLSPPLVSRIQEMAYILTVGGWDFRAEVLQHHTRPN